MSADQEKVKVMRNWPEPKDKSEVKSFLHTLQLCRTFMKIMSGETNSDIKRPLRELTHYKVPICLLSSFNLSLEGSHFLLSLTMILTHPTAYSDGREPSITSPATSSYR